MRKLLFQSFFQRPLTEQATCPRPDSCRGTRRCNSARHTAAPRPKPLDPRNRCRVMQWLRAGDPCAEQCLLRRRTFWYSLRRLATSRRRSFGHGARDQKHARCTGANLSCDPRPEMGHCPRRLRTRWRVFCRQLRGGRRGLANRSRRPSYSGLSATACCDFAGTPFPARSNAKKRHVHLRPGRRLRLSLW
ncbi:hypothetical protein ACVWXO_007165 [Bradyrhizobium sp. LM2.7]